jgi:phosphoglycerol transferase
VKRLLPAASAVTVVLLMLWLSDGVGWNRGYSYSLDELQTVVMSQALMEDGDAQLASRLNAPYGAVWRDFPLIHPVEWVLVWLFSKVGLDCFAATGLMFLCIAGLTGLVAYAAFRELDLPPVSCYAFACVYALQSGLWEHNLSHPHALFPWVAGMSVTLLRLAQGGWSGRLPRWLLVVAFLNGLGSLYLAYYVLFLAPLAVLLGWSSGLRGRWKQPLALGGCFLAGLLLHCGVALAPRPESSARHNAESVTRKPSESELYALKLRILLSPRPNHPLWEGIASRLNEPFPDDQPETVMSRMGTLGSVGLLLSLFWLLVPALRPQRPAWLPALLSLSLAILLLAWIGGFGAMVNALVLAKFRTYNRILPFLSFYSLAIVAYGLRPKHTWLLLGLPVLAGVDQFIPRTRQFPTLGQKFAMDRAWVAQVESRLPPAALVYQFPHRPAVAPPSLYGLRSNEPALGYLHSKALCWTWGALPGPQSHWHEELARLPLGRQFTLLRKLGFSAWWLDRHGLGPEAWRVEGEAVASLGTPMLVSADSRYWLFSLQASGSGQPPLTPALTPPLAAPQRARVELRYSADVQPVRFLSGSHAEVTVTVKNGTDHWLSTGGPHPVSVSYHWVDSEGATVVLDGERTRLEPLAPGAERAVLMVVKTPRHRGRYGLQVRVVQEGVAWFEAPGDKFPADLPVDCGWR